MSGDCDICGSYDHVETRCIADRINDEGGCVRCGLIGCEWADGRGTQHRAEPRFTSPNNPNNQGEST